MDITKSEFKASNDVFKAMVVELQKSGKVCNGFAGHTYKPCRRICKGEESRRKCKSICALQQGYTCGGGCWKRCLDDAGVPPKFALEPCMKKCTRLAGTTSPTEKCIPIDIAVIGGGIGGAYAAWKLKESKQSIHLFEYSNRIGGRVYSRKLPGINHKLAEMGAMRYIPAVETKEGLQGHVYVTKAIESLELETMDFQDYSGDFRSKIWNNTFHLRGTHMKYSDLGSSKVPYNLFHDEMGKSPNQLRRKIYEASVLNPDFGDDKQDQDGIDLSKQRYDRIWRKYGGSIEAMEYVSDALGFDLSEENAASNVPVPAEGSYDEMRFKSLRSGMSALPMTMIKQFAENKPERHKVHKNHKLIRIENQGQNKLLTFQKTSTDNYITSDTQEHVTVCAKRVILALHRDALMEIDWQPLKNQKFIDSRLNAVYGQDALKMYLGYENPWWEGLGYTTGRSVSTLPVSQMLYMGQKKPSSGTLKDQRRKSMMLVYSSYPHASFWDDSLLDSDLLGTPLATNMLASEYNISETILAEAHNQIAEVHQLRPEDLARPYTGVMHYWKQGGPRGSAFYSWKGGADWEIISKQMIKPFEDENVHIVGSCYSKHQYWMEGALNSVEELLTRHYNQKVDTWI
ncbi:unnamed protein product [Owenia fusiformis]|uniref:Amine oxidase domain-containing protein n=1 Tax=Owenia fusiformis TaxID=6347 RepID=A0A8S4NM54_OWEFU|nr:unnamed protein product [Owenia fusiformis]